MAKIIIITLFCAYIIFAIYLLFDSIRFHFNTPKLIMQKYGEPLYSFWTQLLLSIFKNSLAVGGSSKGASTTPVFIAIYNDFIIVKCTKFEIKLTKEDIIEFNKPTFFKNCSMKVRTHDVYNSEVLEFLFINKKCINYLEDFIKKENNN